MKDSMLWELRTGKAFKGNVYTPLSLQGFGPANDNILGLLPWYCDEEKLQFEVNAVRQIFGDRFELKWTRFGEPYWEGFIKTPTISSLIRVYYPGEEPKISYYPILAPKAFPIPSIFNSPHIFKDLTVCLFDPKDPVSLSWNPLTDTAADIIKWADLWLFKQGYWEETGHWPGPVAAHGGLDIPTYLQPLFEENKKRR
jgi:hypothetical protein